MLLWASVRARYCMMMSEGFGESRIIAMRRQQGLEGLHTHGLSDLATWKLWAWHGHKGDERAPCRAQMMSECVQLGTRPYTWPGQSSRAKPRLFLGARVTCNSDSQELHEGRQPVRGESVRSVGNLLDQDEQSKLGPGCSSGGESWTGASSQCLLRVSGFERSRHGRVDGRAPKVGQVARRAWAEKTELAGRSSGC